MLLVGIALLSLHEISFEHHIYDLTTFVVEPYFYIMVANFFSQRILYAKEKWEPLKQLQESLVFVRASRRRKSGSHVKNLYYISL